MNEEMGDPIRAIVRSRVNELIPIFEKWDGSSVFLETEDIDLLVRLATPLSELIAKLAYTRGKQSHSKIGNTNGKLTAELRQATARMNAISDRIEQDLKDEY